MSDSFEPLITQTLAAQAKARQQLGVSATAALGRFQWPWDIAGAGARLLRDHGSAVSALADGGKAVVDSPQGASIVNAISSGATNPANTDQLLNNGLFSNALNTVKADQLLRTVFIGWSTGAQVGLFGGGGGSGVTYDIINQSDRATTQFGSFDIGIGGRVSAGLLLGAMSAPPHNLNYGTCVWQNGVSLGVSVLMMVIMNNDDLSLVGFGLNLGGGGGISSSVGYGKISSS